ncbi:MAG: hypothetical protein EOR99_32305 [Mesorhizobium sp.]|nr:MAG: hypothetical protein EOR99_32305 [Mesorhizobium sp.]
MNVETAPTATSRGVGHGDFGGDPGITDSDVSLSSDTDISRTAAASVYEAEVQPTDVLVFSDDPFPTEISAIIPSEPAVPEGNVVRQDPTVAFDNLFGTPGQTDIFVMEFTEVSPGAESNSAVINGYEPGIDKIAYVNQPEVGTGRGCRKLEFFSGPPGTIAVSGWTTIRPSPMLISIPTPLGRRGPKACSRSLMRKSLSPTSSSITTIRS